MNHYAYVHNDPLSYVDPTGKAGEAQGPGTLLDLWLSGYNKKGIGRIALDTNLKVAQHSMIAIDLSNAGIAKDFTEIAAQIANGEQIAGKLGGAVWGESASKIAEAALQTKFGKPLTEVGSSVIGKYVGDSVESAINEGVSKNGNSSEIDVLLQAEPQMTDPTQITA